MQRGEPFPSLNDLGRTVAHRQLIDGCFDERRTWAIAQNALCKDLVASGSQNTANKKGETNENYEEYTDSDDIGLGAGGADDGL